MYKKHILDEVKQLAARHHVPLETVEEIIHEEVQKEESTEKLTRQGIQNAGFVRLGRTGKETLGEIKAPRFSLGENVSFRLKKNGEVITGCVEVVDRYGTIEQRKEPSYDIYRIGNKTLYKHIPESDIMCSLGWAEAEQRISVGGCSTLFYPRYSVSSNIEKT